MPSPDITSAARRLADGVRLCRDANATPSHLDRNALIALLPILDALAAMPEPDEARVERMAGILAQCGESTATNGQIFVDVRDEARAVIRLADAERAAEALQPSNDRSRDHRDLTVEQSRADQIARYGSVMKPL